MALKADPPQLRRDIFFVPLGSRPLPIRFECRLLLEIGNGESEINPAYASDYRAHTHALGVFIITPPDAV
ncbi:hypothetical protein CN131_00115 [Sinorhizobium meliloti]|nr:hypothetical protein CN131_00115 [Sinorhizobium meliloti]RVQ54406.1 hypothetical protein CN245_19775 [Sinorhizobium meliloti]